MVRAGVRAVVRAGVRAVVRAVVRDRTGRHDQAAYALAELILTPNRSKFGGRKRPANTIGRATLSSAIARSLSVGWTDAGILCATSVSPRVAARPAVSTTSRKSPKPRRGTGCKLMPIVGGERFRPPRPEPFGAAKRKAARISARPS